MKSRSNLAKRIISLICLVAVITAFLCSCSVFKSKEDLLTSEEWYRVSSSGYGGLMCQKIRFYSNGKATSSWYYYYSDHWSYDGSRNYNWEVLDDDTLVYNSGYYDWDDEWKVTGNELIIDGKVYTHDNSGIDD